MLGHLDSVSEPPLRTGVSTALRAKLEEEKAAAQLAARAGATYCPEWLGGRVLPSGGRGYSFILETEDYAVKIAGEHMTT